MQEYTLTVLPEESGRRLDLFVADFSQKQKLGFSRQFIQKLITSGNISLNNTPQKLKSHYKVKEADLVYIRVEEKKQDSLDAEDIPLEVVYEDEDLAVINKPAGFVVHPAPGNPRHTLVNALVYRFKNLSDINPQRPGIVHRLDKETSGLLVIAKNNAAHLELAKQFAAHTIKRKYIAIVKGKVEFDENLIELPIGRHPLKRKSMVVSFAQNSRPALTYYRTLKRTKDYSLLELKPQTGRTHQLRVHLAFIGYPVLGDIKYGKNDQGQRMYLHAESIAFAHPRTGKFTEFSSEMPAEFKEFLNKNA